MDVIDGVFAISSSIRYVALYQRGVLVSRQAEGVSDSSASESDKYEELIVNPTLLTLVRQRGDIDCGDARFVLVRYGNFYQLVLDLSVGHASICFDLEANPLEFASRILSALAAAQG